MNSVPPNLFTLLPIDALNAINTKQEEILNTLKRIEESKITKISSTYITAIEFMEAVRICRSKFDSLVEENKVKTIKKGRKIYVPTTEIERYFTDPTIK